MAEKTNKTAIIITGVCALIIGIVIGFFIGGRRPPVTPVIVGATPQGSSTNTTVDTARNNSNYSNTNALDLGSSISAPSVAAITVSDQAAGDSVVVSLVSTDAPAWVALRENNNGLVGNILGAKRIDVGTTGSVEIPLLRPTQAGKSYYVVLFKDNGDKVFDFKTDAPMTADGTLISKTFSVR